MVNKGFPKFSMSQSGSQITALKNYNLPDFVLNIVAKECNSELLEKGRIDDRLQSMNNRALDMLHKVFVDSSDDKEGKFANLRFYAYITSMYHKCEILVNESIPGGSRKNHKVPVAVKNNGMYTAVAYNKAVGNSINKKETSKFYRIVDDIKAGEHGTQLTEAIYGSSVGFSSEAVAELERLAKARTTEPEAALKFRLANFEGNIYSIISD
ncbi:MAG: hypothetical protein K8823_463 [Cenarchaeum symbiont of Oopsacas minuta]|nr:hypothetical protein [Cenarchaeum symbiont of Oopsacas minuta]